MPTKFTDNFDDSGDDTILANHVKQYIEPIQNLESGKAFFREDIGTDDDYKVDFSPDFVDSDNYVEDYAPGLTVVFTPKADNTGPASLTIRGATNAIPPVAVDLASIPLKKGGEDLDTGDIVAGQVVIAVYVEDDLGANPRFEVIGGIGSGSGGGSGGGADKLDDLDDVAITLPLATGQTLRYSESANEFVNAALGVVDITGLQGELDDKQDTLTDVDEVPGLTLALAGKQATSEKGQINGYAGLDGTGKVPVAQLPASVGGTVNVLDDLDDVEIVGTPAPGQVLRHDGSDFTNEALVIADVTDLQDELDDKQDTLTGAGDVPGLVSALAGKQDESEKGQADGYASLGSDGKLPSGQMPEIGIADVTDLGAELMAKQDTLTEVDDVPGLTTALDGKQDILEKGNAGGYASLGVDGKVPAAQLPPSSGSGVDDLDDLADVTISTPTSGQVIRYNGTAFVNAAVGVSDVNGLSLELAGKQDTLTGTADVPGLDTALSGKASASHVHSAADITSGTLPVARGGTGADNAADARTNLGAQAQDDALDEIATLTMAKGDILVHNGSEVSKMSPGSNGQLLAADSTQTTGLTWVSGSSSGAPTGTANKVAYFNNSGALSSTGNLSYVDSASRMGVGQSTPASALHVTSAATGAVDGSTGVRVSRSSTTVGMEAGLSNDSYVGTLAGGAFSVRTNNVPRFSLDATGNCTLFPPIVGGQKLSLAGFSGAPNGSKGLELSTADDYLLRMEVDNGQNSYIGTVYGNSFHLRTHNVPRFSLDPSGNCTLFPPIVGGQKLSLSGFSGAPNGSKGIELRTADNYLMRMEVDNGQNSYIGTVYGNSFHLRTYNVPRFSLDPSGNCTLFPAIVGGQKLSLSGFSGAPNGSKGIELSTTGGWIARMEVDSGNESYIGTVYGNSFNIRTGNLPRFTLNGSGHCTRFPEIVDGQKLKLSGYSGTPDGNKGIELITTDGWIARMEVDSGGGSYVGTHFWNDFSLRTNNTPRFTLNGYTGQCTLFPEIVGGQKLKLSGFSGAVNGNKGIEIVGGATVKMEAGNSQDSYVGTVNNGDFNLRRNNVSVIGLGSTAAELNNNYAMRFKEATANGTSYVELKGPASLAGNISMTLPSTIGTANQVLKTDGSGNLSWGDPHVTGSGTASRLTFWSSSSGLTSEANFVKDGTTLKVPTLEATNVKSSATFTSTSDTLNLTCNWTAGGTTYVAPRAKFQNGQSFINSVRNVAGGQVMYWDTTTGELAYQFSRGAHKEDVKPVELSMEDLMKWRPVEFKWKEKFGGTQDVGFIAEEVASVYPLAATYDQPWEYTDEKTGEYAVDENGMPKRLEGDSVVAGVKYEKAWIPMLAGVQDFFKRFQALEKKMEERLAVLEGAR